MVVNFRFTKRFSPIRGFVSQTICLIIYYYYDNLLFEGNKHKLYFFKNDLYSVGTFLTEILRKNFEKKLSCNVENVFRVEDCKFLMGERLKEWKINKHLKKLTT